MNEKRYKGHAIYVYIFQPVLDDGIQHIKSRTSKNF